MNLHSLTLLARYAPSILGRALPLEPSGLVGGWDGRGIDDCTPEVREALSALRLLVSLSLTDRWAAYSLYAVHVQDSKIARKVVAPLLADLAIEAANLPRPIKRPLKPAKLATWTARGIALYQRAAGIWARL